MVITCGPSTVRHVSLRHPPLWTFTTHHSGSQRVGENRFVDGTRTTPNDGNSTKWLEGPHDNNTEVIHSQDSRWPPILPLVPSNNKVSSIVRTIVRQNIGVKRCHLGKITRLRCKNPIKCVIYYISICSDTKSDWLSLTGVIYYSLVSSTLSSGGVTFNL